MILEVTRIPNSWEYEVPGFGKGHIESATLGKNQGKLFLISKDFKKVNEIKVIEKHTVQVPFGRTVNVADKIEIVRENLTYKEVFFEVARKTNFTIDGMDMVFEGFTFNRYWNGWEMPMFELKIAKRIIKAFKNDDEKMSYSKSQDAFIFRRMDYPEELPLIEKGHDILCDDGNVYHVYDIGAASWIWSEVEESEG